MPLEDVLLEAYKGTRRKHMKFRQIGHTTSQYGQSFFSETISAWNRLAFAEAPSLAVFNLTYLLNLRVYGCIRGTMPVRTHIHFRSSNGLIEI